jgi:hypothetical protein
MMRSISSVRHAGPFGGFREVLAPASCGFAFASITESWPSAFIRKSMRA